MAPKRPSHLEDRVAAPSSSEEEDDASSEEEEEEEGPSEDEEEPAEKAPPKKASTLSSPIKKPPSKTQPAESSDESSSDSDPGDSAAVKPIASKPMQDSAASASASASAKKFRTKTPAKRPTDGEASASAAKSSKRAKTKPDADEAPAKSSGGATSEKKLFQRLWSEEDEVAILKGMLDYLKKGSDPNADMVGFQGFIRKSITVQDFTKSQLQDKVRRLKKKYVNNVKKKKYEPTNPLEKTVFELSKKIWGNKPVPGPGPNGTPSSAAAAPRDNGKAATPKPALPSLEAMPEADAKASDSGILSGVVGLERSPLPEAVVRRGLDLVPADKKAKLEADWRKIHLAEVELFAKKVQLMSEQSRLIFEALRSDS